MLAGVMRKRDVIIVFTAVLIVFTEPKPVNSRIYYRVVRELQINVRL